MFKVTFLYLNQIKVLYCDDVDATGMLVTVKGIVRNPEKGCVRYDVLKNESALLDSYPEFKDRTLIRIPISMVLLIESFDYPVFRLIDEVRDNLYPL